MKAQIILTASIPPQEVSEVISIIEGAGGSLIQLEMEEKPKTRKQQKKRKQLTHELIQDILTWKNKHPAWTNQQLGDKFGVSRTQVSLLLRGKTKLQQELAKAQGGKKK